MYTATTKGIEVSVMPVFIDERSDPSAGKYFWAYRVVIRNHGEKTFQLVSRYWHIMDAKGRVEEVSGPGVVGEQPVLNPGDSYEYTSGCPLNTPSGIMKGHFTVVLDNNNELDVTIPAFSLDLPDIEPTVN